MLFSLDCRIKAGRERKRYGNSITNDGFPDFSATVIPRSASDEESYCKDFSLPLEMTREPILLLASVCGHFVE